MVSGSFGRGCLERLRHVEKIGDAVDAQDRSGGGRIQHFITAGQGPGMETAALAAISVRPALITITGLESATSVRRRERRASPTDSM